MNNLKNLLTKPLQLQSLPKWIPITILVLSLAGFADATYLTVKHYQGIIPPCSISGCEVVLSSDYSVILGIPVPLLGVVFYSILILATFIYLDSKNTRVKDVGLTVIMGISTLGLLAALGFIAIMLFVLHAICIYCMVSDTITIFIAIFAFHIFRLNMKAVASSVLTENNGK